MTNKDLMSALQKYGSGHTQKDKKDSDSPTQAPIYGPKTTAVADEPLPTKSDKKSTSDSNVYPDIYGPEVVASPGEKVTSAKHSSDNVEDDTYDYNPDLQKAFPTSGPPQPFLADFSRFQK